MERFQSIWRIPWRAINEAPDEQSRMSQIAGLLWMMAAGTAAIGVFLPGSSHGSTGWVLVVCAVVFLYGLASTFRWIHLDKASIKWHAVITLGTFPMIGLAIYLMGNAQAYVEPLLVIPLLYCAFFFPRRLAWLLTFALLAVAGLPLLTDPDAIDQAFLPRYLALCVGFIAATWVIVGLRERLNAAEQRQREMANTDPLTGVGNRRSFEERFDGELAKRSNSSQRRKDDGTPLTLLILDLDGFKGINDRFGHPAGDEILCEVADRAAGLLRAEDTLARIGGDEFAVIAPGADCRRAEQLAKELRDHVSADSRDLPRVDISVGWAVFPVDGLDSGALLQTADARMLTTKRERRT